jgi:hypothetical protein
MQLRKRALGISLGLVWGLTILLTTWWLLIRGNPGVITSKLAAIYIGYTFSWVGSLIGFIWGFVDGFIAGVLIAWFYNFFSKKFYKAKPAS